MYSEYCYGVADVPTGTCNFAVRRGGEGGGGGVRFKRITLNSVGVYSTLSKILTFDCLAEKSDISLQSSTT